MMKQITLWIDSHAPLLLSITILSLIMFIATIIAIPIFFVAIPYDFFAHREKRFPILKNTHPALRILIIILKNIIGSIFLLLGFIMLFLPGQGLLTILVGISFIDFAGKRKFILKIIQNEKVLNSLNKIRKHFNKKPLKF